MAEVSTVHRRRSPLEHVTAIVLIAGMTALGAPAPAEAATDREKALLPVMPDAAKVEPLDLSIEHSPLKCVASAKKPRIEARVLPGTNLESGYVFFRRSGTKPYYYVFLNKGARDDVSGLMPAPNPDTKSIDYYLQALNRQRLAKETAAFNPAVVQVESECAQYGVPPVEAAPLAPAPDSPAALNNGQEEERKGLIVGLTADGQDPVPPGFNKADIAGVVLVSGAIVTLAAALTAGTSVGAGVASAAAMNNAAAAAAGASAGSGTAAGGAGGAAAAGATGASSAAAAGGISTGVLIGGGAAVAVGAGVAVASGGGSDPQPAVSLVASPSSGQAPITATLTATVSSGTSPFTYSWQFGDGGSATGGPTQVHTYSRPGSYTATVNITDGKSKTASATAIVTASAPPPLSFLEVDASWSGSGNVEVKLVLSGQPVGTAYPQSCGPTSNRTARVILDKPTNGTYTVTATASNCGIGSVTSIPVVFSAVTSGGSVSGCAGVFRTVSVGSTMTACTISLP